MLKIAICDDENVQRDYLGNLVNRWAEKNGCQTTVREYMHAEAFLFAYEDEKDFDILLLDIQMKEMNGIALAERIRREDERVQIVFITAFEDYMPFGYEVSALHYLMKPVDEEKLFAVLNKAAKRLRHQEAPVFFSAEEGQLKLFPSEIYYAEAFAHTCSVVLQDRKILIAAGIGEMAAKLGEGFVRCHRSYLVHVKHIATLTKSTALLDNGKSVPVSRRLFRQVNEAFLRYFYPEALRGEGGNE